MGSKGSSQPSHTTQTTTQEPPSWLVPYLKEGAGDVSAWKDWSLSEPAYPSFSTVAPFTPYQLYGQDITAQGANQMMPQIGSYQGTGLDLLNPYGDPTMQMYGAYMPGALYNLSGMMSGAGGQTPSNYSSLEQMMSATPNMGVWGPLMNQAADTMTRSFTEEVMPALRRDAMLSGQYMGGSRPGIAGGLAADRLYQNIGNMENQIIQQAATEALNQRTAGTQIAGQQGLGYGGLGLNAANAIMGGGNDILSRLMSGQLGALSMGPQTLGLGTLPGSIYSAIGGEQQGQMQNQLTDEVNRWFAERGNPLDTLGNYMNLLQGNFGGTTTSQVPYWGADPMMSMLGGGLAGYGIGSSLPLLDLGMGTTMSMGWPLAIAGMMLS